MRTCFVVAGMTDASYTPFIVVSTFDLKQALEAFAAVSALAPHAAIALHAWEGPHGGSILRSQGGVWRLEVPELLPSVAVVAHEAVPA